MNTSFRRAVALTGLSIASALYVGTARAGCYSDALSVPQMQQQSWHGDGQVRLMPVDWRHRDDDVVGYWNIVVSSLGNAGIPDGKVLDRGLQQWHDDGTEFLNSSAQHPATQNYCMGTWEQTGPYTYKLNHFAYTYDANQTANGVVRIREEVRLNRAGTEMSGSQVVDIYDALRNHLATLRGSLVGRRITLDTTAQEIH